MELERLVDELSFRLRLLQAKEEASPEPDDLTGREVLLLELVHRHGEMTISQIGSLFAGMATSTLSVTITKLWRAKLVSKTRDPENQRVTRVMLTKQGQQKLAKGKENRGAQYGAFIQALELSDEEARIFVSLLERAATYFDKVLAVPQEGHRKT